MALESWAQNVVSVSVLDFRSQITLPAVFTKEMFAGHFQRVLPVIRNDIQANFALKQSTLLCKIDENFAGTITSCRSDPVSVEALESKDPA